MAYKDDKKQAATYHNELLRKEDIHARHNRTPRIPVWFCVEVTGEVAFEDIAHQIQALMQSIQSDYTLSSAVELGVMTFGEKVKILRKLALLTDSNAEKNVAPVQERIPGSQAALAEALERTVLEIRKCRRIHDTQGVEFRCPSIFLFSSGNNKRDSEKLQIIQQELKIRCQTRICQVYPITNNPEDPFLKGVSPSGKCYPIGIRNYAELFSSINKSMQSLSHSTDSTLR